MNISIPEAAQDLIINIINIIVLFLIVSLLVYKPVRKFLAERTARIEAKKAEADGKLQEIEKREEEIALEKKKMREQSAEIISDAEHTAKINSDKIINEAHKDARRIVEKARRETVTEHNEMISSLNGDIAHLAVEMSERILKREITDADNARIASDFFSEENSAARGMLENTAKRLRRAEKLAAEKNGEDE